MTTDELTDYFAEIEECLSTIQSTLRHRQQPQDVTFHRALKACRNGKDLLQSRRLSDRAAVEDGFLRQLRADLKWLQDAGGRATPQWIAGIAFQAIRALSTPAPGEDGGRGESGGHTPDDRSRSMNRQARHG